MRLEKYGYAGVSDVKSDIELLNQFVDVTIKWQMHQRNRLAADLKNQKAALENAKSYQAWQRDYLAMQMMRADRVEILRERKQWSDSAKRTLDVVNRVWDWLYLSTSSNRIAYSINWLARKFLIPPPKELTAAAVEDWMGKTMNHIVADRDGMKKHIDSQVSAFHERWNPASFMKA